MTPETNATLLMGIDLEDIRHHFPGGRSFRSRVASLTVEYLDFFQRHGMHATFFTVGSVIREYASLVDEVKKAGHEIACHTDTHEPLHRHTPESFHKDLMQWREVASRHGLERAAGFRAPVLSLTPATQWTYKALRDHGFTYSSSVLPARNPLFGWPGCNKNPHLREEGIWELPISTVAVGPMTVPLAAGVYLRALPAPLLAHAAKRAAAVGRPIVGYLHPYDIDTEQERFMMPGINNSKFYNWLMYYNRGSVFHKLERLIQSGMKIETYRDYVARLTHESSAPARNVA